MLLLSLWAKPCGDCFKYTTHIWSMEKLCCLVEKQRNLKTKFSHRKCGIKCFSFTSTSRRNLNNYWQQKRSSAPLVTGLSRRHCFPTTLKRKPGVFKFLRCCIAFSKASIFWSELVWTVGLTVEIKLRLAFKFLWRIAIDYALRQGALFSSRTITSGALRKGVLRNSKLNSEGVMNGEVKAIKNLGHSSPVSMVQE